MFSPMAFTLIWVPVMIRSVDFGKFLITCGPSHPSTCDLLACRWTPEGGPHITIHHKCMKIIKWESFALTYICLPERGEGGFGWGCVWFWGTTKRKRKRLSPRVCVFLSAIFVIRENLKRVNFVELYKKHRSSEHNKHVFITNVINYLVSGFCIGLCKHSYE